METDRRGFLAATLVVATAALVPWKSKPEAKRDSVVRSDLDACYLAEDSFELKNQFGEVVDIVYFGRRKVPHDFDPKTFRCRKCGIGEHELRTK
jgi:hypothetical protein